MKRLLTVAVLAVAVSSACAPLVKKPVAPGRDGKQASGVAGFDDVASKK